MRTVQIALVANCITRYVAATTGAFTLQELTAGGGSAVSHGAELLVTVAVAAVVPLSCAAPLLLARRLLLALLLLVLTLLQVGV
jgi:hypothetical protein